MNKEEKHILTMLVNNVPGVTARVSSLFAGRGYNIESFCGAPTAKQEVSRITITTKTKPEQYEQVMKQIRKLIDVIKLRDMTGEEAVKRELAMVYITFNDKNRDELFRIIETFGGKAADISKKHVIVELTAPEDKIDAFLDMTASFGIKKVSRSGPLALYKDLV